MKKNISPGFVIFFTISYPVVFCFECKSVLKAMPLEHTKRKTMETIGDMWKPEYTRVNFWLTTTTRVIKCVLTAAMWWGFLVTAVAAVGAVEDAAATLQEREWFQASLHLEELNQFCSLWCQPRWLHCLDLFSRSQRIAKAWQRHGYDSVSYDVATCEEDDILSRTGFLQSLGFGLVVFLAFFLEDVCFGQRGRGGAGGRSAHKMQQVMHCEVSRHHLRLVDRGILCLGPPCSLWIPTPQSVHGRYESWKVMKCNETYWNPDEM